MSINKKYIIASAMMASVALPLMNASHVDAATDMRTVTASSLNFRTGPSTSYSIINVLMNGQKVEYISTSTPIIGYDITEITENMDFPRIDYEKLFY